MQDLLRQVLDSEPAYEIKFYPDSISENHRPEPLYTKVYFRNEMPEALVEHLADIPLYTHAKFAFVNGLACLCRKVVVARK